MSGSGGWPTCESGVPHISTRCRSYDDRISRNNGAVQIIYDGDGNRVAKTVSGVTTRYLVDDLNPTGYAQVVEELSSGGAVQRQYSYGLQRISQKSARLQHLDPELLRLRRLRDGTPIDEFRWRDHDTYDYDAFGNKINSTGTTPNNYFYRSEQFDSDLGLYYLRARYYNPLTGRFMGRDPLDGSTFDPASLHKYLYAGGTR